MFFDMELGIVQCSSSSIAGFLNFKAAGKGLDAQKAVDKNGCRLALVNP